MPRAARRSAASTGDIREDALYEEIADLLRTMPSDWRRQYRSGRDKLAAIGGPVLPDTPTPEQAMLLIGITAGGNPSGDTPYGPHRVPAAVRQAAMKGIRLSHANNYGAWDFIGLARAIELVIVPSVSDTTFKRMGKYLFRHKKDTLAGGFGNDANPSRGYMAWLNWGGDPAVSWTRAFEKNPADGGGPAPAAEAITSDALKVPKNAKRLPARAVAVVTPVPSGSSARGDLFVLLLDPKVLRQKTVTGQDVLGYATSTYDFQRDEAQIEVAAAEKGYGYLLYATMANLAQEVAKSNRGGKPTLRGSSLQTNYAERFWGRQPGGVLKPLSEDEFRAQFGTTYEALTKRGEALVEKAVKATGTDLQTVLATFRFDLGSPYFSSYYDVSSMASFRLDVARLPRPASPRETVSAILKSRKRGEFRTQNLALLPLGLASATRIPPSLLIEVPRGTSTLQPENVLARIHAGTDGRDLRSVHRFGRLHFAEMADPRSVVELMALLETYQTTHATTEQVRQTRRMRERGLALKEALEDAGFQTDEDIRAYGLYLATAANSYTERATEVERMPPVKVANPRRFPRAVTITMPI